MTGAQAALVVDAPRIASWVSGQPEASGHGHEPATPNGQWPAAELVRALVLAAADGDQSAWNALIDRFSSMIWAICRSCGLGATDAADVSQTTWLRLVEHLDSIQQPERVGAWLATTARREAMRLSGGSRRVLPVGDDRVFDSGLPDDGTPTQRLVVEERDEILHKAFSRLPTRARVLLLMLSCEPAMSYREISAALNMPIGSIGPTRGRCLEALRQHALALGLSGSDLT